MTNWKAADLVYIETLIQIVREFYEHWGRWPTPEEVRQLLNPN